MVKTITLPKWAPHRCQSHDARYGEILRPLLYDTVWTGCS